MAKSTSGSYSDTWSVAQIWPLFFLFSAVELAESMESIQKAAEKLGVQAGCSGWVFRLGVQVDSIRL